jgi:DnaJ-class molecular chaperone
MAQVKRAYKDMALKYHPDRHMELTESDRQLFEDGFKKYKEVYDLIIECWP